MNKTKTGLKTSISALGLLLLLLSPLCVQFSHLFEAHEHLVCTETTTHFHEAPIDCSLCDFQFQSFNFQPLKQLQLIKLPLILSISEAIVSIDAKVIYYNYGLRAPPYFT